MSKRELATIDKFEGLHRPVENGDHNEVHELCEFVLDNWRSFTKLQIQIACTMLNLREPATTMSEKQRFHINEMLKMYREIKGLPDPGIVYDWAAALKAW